MYQRVNGCRLSEPALFVRARRWQCAAIIAILLSAASFSAVRAQLAESLSDAHAPIDVWGSTGRAFGTITFQPVNGSNGAEGLQATFGPSVGSLADLAAKLWPRAPQRCLHFNWIQICTDSGLPPLPMGHDGSTLQPPYIDPPPGGYAADRGAADALPWFHDETPYHKPDSSSYNIHNPNVTQPGFLRWGGMPGSTRRPDHMAFDVILVLVNDCEKRYQPLGGFHFNVQFPAHGRELLDTSPFGPLERFPYERLVTTFGARTNSGPGSGTSHWSIRPTVVLAAPGRR